LPSNLSIKKPCQYFDRSCKTADTQTATVTTFGKAPDDVHAIPSSILSPIGKLVLYAYASKGLGKNVVISMSDGEVAARCGVSRPSVIMALRRLVGLGLIKKIGKPVNQVQAYQICHPMFAHSDAAVSLEQVRDPIYVAACLKCHREVKRLTRAGYCRACHKDEEIAAKVRQVRVAHPGAEAEEIAVILKDQHQLRRMTARVRRVLRQGAA